MDAPFLPQDEYADELKDLARWYDQEYAVIECQQNQGILTPGQFDRADKELNREYNRRYDVIRRQYERS